MRQLVKMKNIPRKRDTPTQMTQTLRLGESEVFIPAQVDQYQLQADRLKILVQSLSRSQNIRKKSPVVQKNPIKQNQMIQKVVLQAPKVDFTPKKLGYIPVNKKGVIPYNDQPVQPKKQQFQFCQNLDKYLVRQTDSSIDIQPIQNKTLNNTIESENDDDSWAKISQQQENDIYVKDLQTPDANVTDMPQPSITPAKSKYGKQAVQDVDDDSEEEQIAAVVKPKQVQKRGGKNLGLQHADSCQQNQMDIMKEVALISAREMEEEQQAIQSEENKSVQNQNGQSRLAQAKNKDELDMEPSDANMQDIPAQKPQQQSSKYQQQTTQDDDSDDAEENLPSYQQSQPKSRVGRGLQLQHADSCKQDQQELFDLASSIQNETSNKTSKQPNAQTPQKAKPQPAKGRFGGQLQHVDSCQQNQMEMMKQAALESSSESDDVVSQQPQSTSNSQQQSRFAKTKNKEELDMEPSDANVTDMPQPSITPAKSKYGKQAVQDVDDDSEEEQIAAVVKPKQVQKRGGKNLGLQHADSCQQNQMDIMKEVALISAREMEEEQQAIQSEENKSVQNQNGQSRLAQAKNKDELDMEPSDANMQDIPAQKPQQQSSKYQQQTTQDDDSDDAEENLPSYQQSQPKSRVGRGLQLQHADSCKQDQQELFDLASSIQNETSNKTSKQPNAQTPQKAKPQPAKGRFGGQLQHVDSCQQNQMEMMKQAALESSSESDDVVSQQPQSTSNSQQQSRFAKTKNKEELDMEPSDANVTDMPQPSITPAKSKYGKQAVQDVDDDSEEEQIAAVVKPKQVQKRGGKNLGLQHADSCQQNQMDIMKEVALISAREMEEEQQAIQSEENKSVQNQNGQSRLAQAKNKDELDMEPSDANMQDIPAQKPQQQSSKYQQQTTQDDDSDDAEENLPSYQQSQPKSRVGRGLQLQHADSCKQDQQELFDLASSIQNETSNKTSKQPNAQTPQKAKPQPAKGRFGGQLQHVDSCQQNQMEMMKQAALESSSESDDVVSQQPQSTSNSQQQSRFAKTKNKEELDMEPSDANVTDMPQPSITPAKSKYGKQAVQDVDDDSEEEQIAAVVKPKQVQKRGGKNLGLQHADSCQQNQMDIMKEVALISAREMEEEQQAIQSEENKSVQNQNGQSRLAQAKNKDELDMEPSDANMQDIPAQKPQQQSSKYQQQTTQDDDSDDAEENLPSYQQSQPKSRVGRGLQLQHADSCKQDQQELFDLASSIQNETSNKTSKQPNAQTPQKAKPQPAKGRFGGQLQHVDSCQQNQMEMMKQAALESSSESDDVVSQQPQSTSNSQQQSRFAKTKNKEELDMEPSDANVTDMPQPSITPAKSKYGKQAVQDVDDDSEEEQIAAVVKPKQVQKRGGKNLGLQHADSCQQNQMDIMKEVALISAHEMEKSELSNSELTDSYLPIKPNQELEKPKIQLNVDQINNPKSRFTKAHDIDDSEEDDQLELKAPKAPKVPVRAQLALSHRDSYKQNQLEVFEIAQQAQNSSLADKRNSSLTKILSLKPPQSPRKRFNESLSHRDSCKENQQEIISYASQILSNASMKSDRSYKPHSQIAEQIANQPKVPQLRQRSFVRPDSAKQNSFEVIKVESARKGLVDDFGAGIQPVQSGMLSQMLTSVFQSEGEHTFVQPQTKEVTFVGSNALNLSQQIAEFEKSFQK